MYYFYIDKILLPVAPSKLQTKVNGANKTYTLINEGEINVLKTPKLTDIEFDALLPSVQYPFATYKSGFQKPLYYLDKLETLKAEKKTFQFIVTRTFPDGKMLFDTNMKVSLESYTIKEDAKSNGMDLVVTIKLKQYRDYATKTCKVTQKKDEKPKVTQTKERAVENPPKPQNKTYTVVKGDCLWNIAKKFYGDGSKYTKIVSANQNIFSKRSPNLIYAGDVLVIPDA